ncbi:MAG: radical SAM protein, partial [Spirochaetales bacterium]|nr:radical SAM protein [Spirochaetales bacterium]
MGLKVAVYTLGCKLNQCESEALASSFESRGFFITSPRDPADIYIVNTCTVTSKSEQKARRMIRKFASDFCGSVVIVTGCYAQLDKGDLNIADNVIVIPNDDKDRLNELPDYLAASLSLSDASLLELVKNFFVKADSPCMSNRFWFGSVDFSYHTRAFLKIQDGCNNKCAYCRVTIARGPSVSLSPDLVVKNYISLHEKGFREVVLTGINLTSYNSEGVNFSQLLIKLLEVAEKLEKPPRIRISSIEPDSIDSEMIKAVSNDLICPHFHISVQSGSD